MTVEDEILREIKYINQWLELLSKQLNNIDNILRMTMSK